MTVNNIKTPKHDNNAFKFYYSPPLSLNMLKNTNNVVITKDKTNIHNSITPAYTKREMKHVRKIKNTK